MNTNGLYEVVYDGIVWHKMTYRKYYKPVGVDDTDLAWGKLLHQYIYITRIGAIPKGYEIHHIDENPYNNSISNLQALPVTIHRRIKPAHYHVSEEGHAKLSLLSSLRSLRKPNYILYDYLTQLVKMHSYSHVKNVKGKDRVESNS